MCEFVSWIEKKGMEELVKEAGFSDLEEFNRLVANVDISTPKKLAAFKEWQHNDGTKNGLLLLEKGGNAT